MSFCHPPVSLSIYLPFCAFAIDMPQCPPCPACMHTLLRLQEAIVLCEQNFSLQVCTSLLQSWLGLLMVAPGDLWCFNSFYSSIHWQWMKWIKPRWKCKSRNVCMCKFSSVFIHCVDIGRNVTWSSCPGFRATLKSLDDLQHSSNVEYNLVSVNHNHFTRVQHNIFV